LTCALEWPVIAASKSETIERRFSCLRKRIDSPVFFSIFAERLCGLLQVSSLISLQLDRSEYVFLLRLMENLKETTTFLALQETLFNPNQQQSVVLGAVLPQVDVSILFPPLAASVQQVSPSAVATLNEI